jgi:hypothetical protein
VGIKKLYDSTKMYTFESRLTLSKSKFEFGHKLHLCYFLLHLFADTSEMHIEDFTSQKVQGQDIT